MSGERATIKRADGSPNDFDVKLANDEYPFAALAVARKPDGSACILIEWQGGYSVGEYDEIPLRSGTRIHAITFRKRKEQTTS